MSSSSGQVSNDRSAIEKTICNAVLELFSWKPSKLRVAPKTSGKYSSTQATRPSAIFDKHFPEQYALKSIVYRPDLLQAIEQLAEDTFNAALPTLPPIDRSFHPDAYYRSELEARQEIDVVNEIAVIDRHLQTTRSFCSQLGSMLALHPSAATWGTVAQSTSPIEGSDAITDMTMMFIAGDRVKPALLKAMDPETCKWQGKPLNKGEFKSLTACPAAAIEGLGTPGDFPWVVCKCILNPKIYPKYAQGRMRHQRHRERSKRLVYRQPGTRNDGNLPLFDCTVFCPFEKTQL
jgi:hypothetical protein